VQFLAPLRVFRVDWGRCNLDQDHRLATLVQLESTATLLDFPAPPAAASLGRIHRAALGANLALFAEQDFIAMQLVWRFPLHVLLDIFLVWVLLLAVAVPWDMFRSLLRAVPVSSVRRGFTAHILL